MYLFVAVDAARDSKASMAMNRFNMFFARLPHWSGLG